MRGDIVWTLQMQRSSWSAGPDRDAGSAALALELVGLMPRVAVGHRVVDASNEIDRALDPDDLRADCRLPWDVFITPRG